jgi:hypothetical protein
MGKLHIAFPATMAILIEIGVAVTGREEQDFQKGKGLSC